MTEETTNKLDVLYEAALESLHKATTGQDTHLDNETRFGIIDRWLARREADRQYELQVKREERERTTVRPI